MNINKIVTQTEEGFAVRYPHFKEFQQDLQYRSYWEQCIGALRDRELLSHIVFCNDVFSIPPVKTFLTYYRTDFIRITGRGDARLDLFVKKSIGAFWGMVFKFVLGYQTQKSVSVSMYDFFVVKTASCFGDPSNKVVLEE